MKRLLGIVMALAMSATGVATGQEMGLFHNPVFVLQPGITRGFGTGATTEFNARFVTAIPLGIERTTLVAIVQWHPFADNGAGGKANSPAFVYGPVINLLNERQFSFDVDGLFAYAPNPLKTPTNGASDYTHQFLVEGDVVLKLGSMMNAKGQFGGLGLYGFLAYVISGQPSGIETKDRMVLLAGLTLPLAPWHK